MVWISTAPGHASNMRPLRNDIGDESSERLQLIVKRYLAGEPLAPDELPAIIYGAPHAQEKDFRFPDLFSGYGFWIVSGSAADVLRQFDLGGGGLHPVRVLKTDRQTPVKGEWFCLNFGNCTQAFSSELSKNVEPRSAGKWIVRAKLSDEDVTVGSVALNGPDVWIDPNMRDVFFLGEALGQALKKAKADKGFFLKKCRVVEGA